MKPIPRLSLPAAMGFSFVMIGCAGPFHSDSSMDSPSMTNVVPSPDSQADQGTLTTTTPLRLPGVNISGAEYGDGVKSVCSSISVRINTASCVYPGWDYVYPSNDQIDYYASKGMKVIRLPFDANRLQPRRNGVLNDIELAFIDAVVQRAASKGLIVLLDPHNYGFLNESDSSGSIAPRAIGVDALMPASKFADLWSRIASHYVNASNVMFGLMNEPYRQTATQWRDAAIAAVAAIRATGAKQKIMIPGTAYTGAHSWVGSGNAAAWAGFTDSNFAFEVHQYLDSDSSGTHDECVAGSGSKALVDFTSWARRNGVKGFLGEIGWSTNSGCMAEGASIMNFMSANTDVWFGYSYWAGGAWLGPYMFSLEPTGLGSASVKDQPQMSILVR